MIAPTLGRRRALADVCLRCCARARAAVPPTLPATVHADRDGLVATYRCRSGHRWSTWWSLEAATATRGSASPAVTQPAAQETTA